METIAWFLYLHCVLLAQVSHLFFCLGQAIEMLAYFSMLERTVSLCPA